MRDVAKPRRPIHPACRPTKRFPRPPWNYDGSNEVEYDYDYNDQTNFPGAVKLWKKDGSNTGWYKVYNNCEDGIGKDGKVGCYLHFYCLDWNTDDLGSDC